MKSSDPPEPTGGRPSDLLAAAARADEQMLIELLSRPPTRGGRGKSAWRRRLRLALLVAVAAAGLVGVFVVGRTALALITIRQNIQAMRLPTPAARPTQLVIAPHSTGGSTAAPAVVQLDAAQARPTSPAPPSATTAPAPQATSMSAVAAGQLAGAITPSPDAWPLSTLTPVPQQLPAIDGAAAAPGSRPVQLAASSSAPPAASQPVTLLLLGVDRRPGETGPARSDALIVLRIDPVRERVAMLSLPRDLIVDIPGYGSARINAASVYGELYPELGGGVELERQTVSNLLGIPIDYVVLVDFNGFIGAIDALGGVDVDVEKELYDPEYPTMDYGYMEVHFLPGPTHMDGATALIYSRVRHMDTIWERARRQQQVLIAVLQRVRQQNPVERVQSIAALTTALRDYVQTDMPIDQMVGLAWALRDITPESVERYNLDGSMIAENADSDDPYAEYALPGVIESLTQQLTNGRAN